jgi:hypothetical protein
MFDYLLKPHLELLLRKEKVLSFLYETEIIVAWSAVGLTSLQLRDIMPALIAAGGLAGTYLAYRKAQDCRKEISETLFALEYRP